MGAALGQAHNITVKLTTRSSTQRCPTRRRGHGQSVLEYAMVFGCVALAGAAGLHTLSSPLTLAYGEVASGLTGNAIWSSSTTYGTGAVVAYNGVVYTSLIASNNFGPPSNYPNDWTTSGGGGGGGGCASGGSHGIGRGGTVLYDAAVTLTGMTTTNSVAYGAKTLTLGSTDVASASGVAVDTSGKIYILDGTPSLAEYAAGSRGTASPTLSISGTNTTITGGRVAVDSSGNMYVVSGGTSVLEFAAGANGNVVPTKTISGNLTTLSGASGVVVDSLGNIYVTNATSNSVTEFAAGANGNVAPTTTISGNLTGLSSPGPIALDTSGNIYVESSGGLEKFAAGWTGSSCNIAPATNITALVCNVSLAVDTSGTMYSSCTGGLAASNVYEWAAGSNGNVAPTTSFTSGNGVNQLAIG